MPLTAAAVNDVLREHDPERLIAIGAPADEYSAEAEAFHTVLLTRPLTEEDVVRVWTDWLGDASWFLSDADAPARAALVEALNALRD